ncbi:hypothetical protein B1L04_17550 [Microcystis aeruginosa KW]|uniref:Uncharacterized protein n=1 Tax=Microcystis aeruginosa KW TaxID=1960155 RepID=A0A1V4BTL4_MICAE|nr:hypothetical protein B1L04_17550 [Microcystis aeruginosa KW]
MKQPYLIKGGLRGDPPAYRHPPYQGGQGGSNLKSIFNLIITSYLKSSECFEQIAKQPDHYYPSAIQHPER